MHIKLISGIFVLSLSSAHAQSNALTTGYQGVSDEAHQLVEPAAALRLDAAIDLAIRFNPDLASAAHEADAMEATVRQAGTRPNPEVSALIEDTRPETRTTTLQISQSLEIGGQRAARISAAQRALDAAQIDMLLKRAEVQSAVTSAYFDVAIAQERDRLAAISGTLAQRATKAASNRVSAGKVSPVEETKARVAEAGVRVEQIQASAELNLARKKLTAFWNNPTPRFTGAADDVEIVPMLPQLSDLQARFDGLPGMQRVRLEVSRREALAEVEKRRRIPNLTIVLGTKRDAQQGRSQTVVGLSMPLPLFDRNQGNLLEALRRTDKARDEQVATQSRLTNEIAVAHERLSTVLKEIGLLKAEILPGAQSAYDAATKGFEAGKFSFLDVLDAQRTLIQSKSQYLRALSDAHRAAADIDRVVGDVHGLPSIQKP